MDDFLRFRVKQFYRYLKQAGDGLVILLPFSLVVVFFIYWILFDLENAWSQSLISMTIITVHSVRTDRDFIRLHLKEGRKVFHLVEYLIVFMILELPFVFAGGANVYMLYSFMVITVVVFFDNVKIKGFSFDLVRWATSFIPIDSFEWRAGIRKHYLTFGLSYILGLAFLSVLPITPLGMVYWLTFAGEFYALVENREVIQSYRDWNSFAKRKVSRLLLTLNLVFTPHYCVYLYLYGYNSEYLVALIIAIALFNFIFVYALLYKYTKLNEQGQRIGNTVPITFFCLIAVLLPLSIYYFYVAWNKSKNELKLLLK